MNSSIFTNTESTKVEATKGLTWVGISALVLLAFLVLLERSLRSFAYDNFAYMMQALQMRDGNWTPVFYVPVGWPAFLAGIYWMLGVQGMRYAETVSSLTSALLIVATIPLVFLILRRHIRGARLFCAVFLWSLFCPLFFPAWGLSEPLFTLLLLLGVFFLTKQQPLNARDLILAGIFWGFALAVRTAGILFCPVVLLLLVTDPDTRGKRFKYFSFFSLGFFLASGPALIQRALVYGHPFQYNYTITFFDPDQKSVWQWLAIYWRNGFLEQIADFFSSSTRVFPLDTRLVGGFLIASVIALPVLVFRFHRWPDRMLRLSLFLVLVNGAFLCTIWPRWPNFRYWTPFLLMIIFPAFLLWEQLAALWKMGAIQKALLQYLAFFALIVFVYGSWFSEVVAGREQIFLASQKISKIHEDEDPSYINKECAQLAHVVRQLCSGSKLLNVGACDGSYALTMMRHFQDLRLDPKTGKFFSLTEKLSLDVPDKPIRSLEEFVRHYGDGSYVLIIKPDSYEARVEYPYFGSIESPEWKASFEKLHQTPEGTFVYRVHR